MELLSQTRSLTDTNNKLDELNSKTEQWLVEKDKEIHEYKRVIDQLRLENEKLQSDFERVFFKLFWGFWIFWGVLKFLLFFESYYF